MDFGVCQTPPPVSGPVLHSSNQSCSTMESMSDDEILSNKTSASKQIKKFKINAMNNEVLLSDTFDDEYGSDSDYLSSDDQHIDDVTTPTATSEFDLDHKLILHKKKKLLASKSKHTQHDGEHKAHSARPRLVDSDKSDKTADGEEFESDAASTVPVIEFGRHHSNKTESGSFLTLPINESDDNYEQVVHHLPERVHSRSHAKHKRRHHKRMKSQMMTMKELKEAERESENASQSEAGSQAHARSFSESNLHRHGRKRVGSNEEWSSEESADSFDQEENTAQHNIKKRYISMKKKYRKQRRISRQFQDAITSIQDDNEDDIVATEQQIREQFEKEFELKMLELEHQKLNNEMKNDDRIKHVLLENEELMMQNKQLQQQVAAQVAMIQQHQEMALQQTQTFVRMQSGDSILSPVSSMHSPMAALGQFPATPTRHPGLRRVSSASTVSTNFVSPGFGIIPSDNARSHSVDINAATTSNLAFAGTTPALYSSSMNSIPMLTCSANPGGGGGSGSKNGTPSVASQDDNYTLHFHATASQDSNGSDEYFGSAGTDKSNQSSNSIHCGDVERKDAVMNMEPPKRRKKKSHRSKHGTKKKAANTKRRKLHDLETKLLEKDEEIRDKIGDAMTPWDRFLELMTPSFCSCSPAPQQYQKVIEE